MSGGRDRWGNTTKKGTSTQTRGQTRGIGHRAILDQHLELYQLEISNSSHANWVDAGPIGRRFSRRPSSFTTRRARDPSLHSPNCRLRPCTGSFFLALSRLSFPFFMRLV
eukprot:3196973-Rhodomonas_salina.1